MDHKVSKDMISSGMIPSGEKTQADLGKTQYGSAPSPSKLMDAYKSMYGNKEEVINEMKMGDVSGSADFASRNIKDAKGAAPTPKPTPTAVDKPKSKTETDKMLDKVSDRRVEKAVNRDKDVRRARASYIMTKYGESVDLLAAYHSIYEHHKKDADGNTIPHEDEEVNEGKIPAGLQAYLDKKKGKKEDKKEVKEEVDKFNIVYNHFISEGYSEKEAYSKMANLTEEQLDEFVGAAMAGLKAVGGALLKKGVAGLAKAGAGKAGLKATASAFKNPTAGGIKNLAGMAGKGLAKTARKNPMTTYMIARDMMPKGGGGGQQPMMSKQTSSISASADLFDIVKGQLLDEGLSEEEIKDIMLTLTPDEIIKEIEESSMSAGSAGGHYHDGGDGVFRSKQQIGNMFNKNIPTKKQTGGKVDKVTRRAINTSATELGIQGPTTLKQSVEPEGETI